MFQIGVVFGGRSTEHEISLRSGSFIYNNIDRSRFQVKPILISKNGDWFYPNHWNVEWKVPSVTNPELYADEVLRAFCNQTQAQPYNSWTDPSCGGCKLIVLGLHGGEGEDGRIQAFLETTGIAYTGSGVLASSLAMDKFRSNIIFESQNIPVARFIDLTKDRFLFEYEASRPGHAWDRLCANMGMNFPVFSKPSTGGSSVGTFRANDAKEWEEKIRIIFETERRMLVQENIQGREVSCGVIEKPLHGLWEPFALPPTEIIPNSEFFDYSAKYIPGGSNEVTPADMPPEWISKIQEYSMRAHEILGCVGYSRTDFIVTEDGTPWILETNTLPGMTGTSLIPQQAAAVGIEMKQIFTWLIRLGLERRHIPWTEE
ncbi:D-alanine--D-alanine ligase [Leptospira sp. GIMC2001]|uniref:D-alanine--D-alanine ligase n=1 Tax=Leptospira sp. GIMC2001 TaxID=1513297 RepID=UPI00234A6841|nr:D-alanine--D-alanine ligase [Leptospira sp. GIMC2001]WCL50949.1 D-alanine--D-alanine ligase [Leptospira sp. GIMC2001]